MKNDRRKIEGMQMIIHFMPEYFKVIRSGKYWKIIYDVHFGDKDVAENWCKKLKKVKHLEIN